MSFRKLNNNFNVISKNLMKYRKASHLSQAALVKELNLLGINLHKNDMCLIEANKRTVRDYEIWGFMQVLNVSFEDLIDGIDEKLKK